MALHRAEDDGKNASFCRPFLGSYNRKRTSAISIMESVCSKLIGGLLSLYASSGESIARAKFSTLHAETYMRNYVEYSGNR